MDISDTLQEQIQQAAAERRRLRIQGGDSKTFYGRPVTGDVLAVAAHRGIINYQASELVLTARAGTALDEIEQCLAAHGQMLPFEPPHYGAGATLGGTVACGVSGPRRPHAGALRDFILGVRCINGRGEVLRFGGEVVKNVAGFDAARLMAGAQGTLGVLLDISLKVLPRPPEDLTLAFTMAADAAIEAMNRWAARPLPLSASSYEDGVLRLRLSGSPAALAAARAHLGGSAVDNDADYWRGLREQTLDFFADDRPLWRLSVPPATPPLPIVGDWLLEWGGAQRWLKTALPPDIVRATAARAGGHATLFRGGAEAADGAAFHPLPPAMLALHKRLKAAFDPHAILNPGRLFSEL